MNRFANALVRAATADVAAHGIVDVGVGGVGLLGKQRDGGHDLPGLAVAALRDVFFDPGFLNRMAAVRRKAFNGGDFLARDAGDRGNAGTRGFAVDVYGTGSTERHAAPELRTGHAQGVTEHPEQRHVRADIDGLRFAVQGKTDGHGVLPTSRPISYNNTGVVENPKKSVQPGRRSAARIGSRRMRFPVAAKMALATAGAAGGTPGSPQPPGGSALGTIWTSMTGGASLIRRTS